MSFEWPRIHKWEDNILREIDESVQQYVFEFYGVEEIEELTEEQIEELRDFIEGENEYSIMRSGFYTLINWWESQ